MTIPVALRGDFKASQARAVLRGRRRMARRRGASDAGGHLRWAIRTEAAKIGGVTLQIIRDRVMRLSRGGCRPA